MHVFLYGTLQDDVLRSRLLGQDAPVEAATLEDHTVVRQVGAPLPALIARTGEATRGLVLRDCDARTLAVLDVYETPFDYHPQTVTVHIGDTNLSARAYFPGASVRRSEVQWDMGEWEATLGPLSREMMQEIGTADPPYDAEALKRQWHMISLRASVRLRAREDTTPFDVRYAPDPEDVKILHRAPLQGSFYKFAGLQIRHRTFQNTLSDTLNREALIGSDGAIALPYDPVMDRVLLVEQIRMGPLLREDPKPWMLEPVAGMIDGGETPEQAALRETEEEAGLTDRTLHRMFSMYASPGSTTDYFYCFAALGPLPDPTTYTGGLASESEDLRLHVMAFDDALALIDSGEANVGPLVAMLLWLARHRDRLRAAA